MTVGALGLLAWGLVIGALLWSARRLFRPADASSEPALDTTLFGGALYLAAFHLLYVPTVSLSFLMFAFLGVVAAADGVRMRELTLDPASKSDSAMTALVALATAAIIIAALWSVRATVSDMLVNRSAVVYAQEQNAERALTLLRVALFVYPDNDRGHRAAVELGLIRLGEIASAGGTTDQAAAALQV